jgi:hypothetical protein
MKVTVEITRPRMPRRRRARLATIAVLALALVLPATALASHLFTDVPTSMTGHAAIEAVADARITVGCSATTYCPTAGVTREQMALFLQRALPRIAGAQDLVASQLTTSEATQNSIVLRMGGTSGGTQFVKADVSFTAEVVDATGCPCKVYVYITTNTGLTSEGTVISLDSAGFESGNATLSFPAATGTNLTINATAAIEGGGEVYIYTDMSAISGAFGSQGTDLARVGLGTGERGR